MFSGEVPHPAHQGERNAGSDPPGRNDVRKERQKRKVPPVTNASLAVFSAESRTSKTSALWQTGVTI